MQKHIHLCATVAKDALAGTLALALVAYTAFLAAEPWSPNADAQSVDDQFTITQSITGEIAFTTAANDVTMSPSIPGFTGGTANGSTAVAVSTNSPTGFTMTIVASSSPAMQGNTTAGEIEDYAPASAGVPDFAFDTGTAFASFGYTVSASTTADLAQKFLDDTSDCNTGSSDTNGSDSCWYGLATTSTSTIVRTSATPPTGATSTIFFRVFVPPNPTPTVPEDTYTATATLTATVN